MVLEISPPVLFSPASFPGWEVTRRFSVLLEGANWDLFSCVLAGLYGEEETCGTGCSYTSENKRDPENNPCRSKEKKRIKRHGCRLKEDF